MSALNMAWRHYIQEVPPPTIRLFKQFLVASHAYKEYSHNFLNCAKILPVSRIKGGDHLIGQAFIWSDTPQGSIYWNSLNDKWKEIYYEYTKTSQI